MSRENKEDKLFNEIVDRILAGEPVKIDSSNTDLNSAIEFAKKIKDLSPSPSLSFKANLKTRLLQELHNKDAKAEQSGWFQRAFSHRLAWQLGTTMAIILVALGVTWRAGVFQPTGKNDLTSAPPKIASGVTEPVPGPTIMATTTTAGLTSFSGSQTIIQVNTATDKPDYISGETVNIDVSLTNESSSTMEIQPYPLVVTVTDANGQIVYTSDPGSNIISLLPGQTTDFKVSWEKQINTNNNKKAAPGTYYLTIGSITGDSGRTQMNQNSTSSFEILP